MGALDVICALQTYLILKETEKLRMEGKGGKRGERARERESERDSKTHECTYFEDMRAVLTDPRHRCSRSSDSFVNRVTLKTQCNESVAQI